METSEKQEFFVQNLPVNVTEDELRKYFSAAFLVKSVNIHSGYFFDKKIIFNTASLECFPIPDQAMPSDSFIRGKKPIYNTNNTSQILNNSFIIMTQAENFQKLSPQSIQAKFVDISQFFIVYSNYSPFYVVTLESNDALTSVLYSPFTSIDNIPVILKQYPPSLSGQTFCHAAIAFAPYPEIETSEIESEALDEEEKQTSFVVIHNNKEYIIPIFMAITVSGFFQAVLKEKQSEQLIQVVLDPISCDFTPFFKYFCGGVFQVSPSMSESEYRMASYLQLHNILSLLESLFYNSLLVSEALNLVPIYEKYPCGLPPLIRYLASHANMEIVTNLPIDILKQVCKCLYFSGDEETILKAEERITAEGGDIKDMVGLYKLNQLGSNKINDLLLDPSVNLDQFRSSFLSVLIPSE